MSRRNVYVPVRVADYFEHAAGMESTARAVGDVIEWEETGDVEHVTMWTDENGLSNHRSETK